ncbi:MAG: hypothetical protein IVW53_04175 [Chloroflexi bacterium]|nr:hypothetical protein [Chloroflexota bacterium]
MSPFPLPRPAAEALRTERYLDALLAAGDRHAIDVPAPSDLDPAIRIAARQLVAELGRVHPSFRFEERLATRLASVGVTSARVGVTSAGAAAVVPWPDLEERPAVGSEAARRVRPLLIGGALTSAALSLAGAAFFAWRHTRPSRGLG